MGNRSVFQVSRQFQLLKCETIYLRESFWTSLNLYIQSTWAFSAGGKHFSMAGEGLVVAHVSTQGT